MDLAAAGRSILYSAMATGIWAACAPVVGMKLRDARYFESARRALYATSALLVAATVVLLAALFARDFSVEYVANYSSSSLSPAYTLTALWAGMEGSLLFWTVITSVYAVTAIAVQRSRRADLVPIAGAVLGALLAFFCAMLAFGANPFRTLSPIPADGAGLNPLLQSPFMTIHPVLLYLGLTGFAVPFAFAVSALVSGRLDVRWFTSTRRWTVLAWSFLGIGIIVGAGWAYHELGWGGYWAWDPVENASLLPWLVGTAFLHSVLIQERRGMLKVWNAGLILATYCLAIFGTFLTRSGLLSSVHTFSESPLGKYFLPLLAVLVLGAFGLLGWRADRLASERRLDSLVSREGMFLFNNLFFVAIAFTVLWGTLYPILVEAVRGVKVSVGVPFYNSVVGPIGLALLALTGVGPLVAWRRASIANLRRQFTFPLLVGAAMILALATARVRSVGALLALGLCAFVASATIGEFVRGALAHKKGVGWIRALRDVIGRNRRRYGGYIIHLGVVLIFIGLAGSAFTKTWSGLVKPGETFSVGRYEVTYRKAEVYPTSEKMVLMAVMDVRRDGDLLTTLTPQRNFHLAQRQPQSEIGLRTTLSEDLYIVVTQMDASRAATVKSWVNPLVAWIWIGGAVMAAGMIVILSSKPPPIPGISRATVAVQEKEKVNV